MNKVLVTGASGFVGTHLLEALSKLGIQTTALYLSNRPVGAVGGSKALINWIRCDLTKEGIEKHLRDVDIIFHLAGYSGLGSDSATVNKLNNINVIATERIASAAFSARCRMIYVSSVHACEEAPGHRIIDEENGQPRSEYGRSKRCAEDLLRSFGEDGLDFTILRPTQLFGEYHKGSIFELVKAIKQSRFVLLGDGENATNFYYVKDFVDTLLRVAENPICRAKTYIAADEPLRLVDLVDEISRNVKMNPTKFRVPRAIGIILGAICDVLATSLRIRMPLSRQRVRAMTRDVRYSNRKLMTDIEVSVPYGIRNGLARTIAWYQSTRLL
jgi:nucleoside-diphosphate-sugar epimerase